MEPQGSFSLWSSYLMVQLPDLREIISSYHMITSVLVIELFVIIVLYQEDWPEGHQLAANMKFKFMQVV